MRVLIVDDEAVPRLMLKMAVESFGHDCMVAEDGSEAWDIYQNTGIQVIISDRMMPGLDGIELCRRVRQRPQDGYTYFVFLTALGEKRELLSGIQAGADDYLTKPLDPDDLHMCLLVAARITALHRELQEQRSELKRLNQQLFEQGRRDPLTQMGNRLRLMEDMHSVIAQAQRYGQHYCVAMCDIDHFKSYNDCYGHLAGDEVLRSVAKVITETCRASDVAYRYGGEEFMLVLPEPSAVQAFAAAERVRKAIEALAIPHAAAPPPGIITVSIGIASLEPADPNAVHLWFKRADEALYRAKQAGRNRVAASGPTATAI